MVNTTDHFERLVQKRHSHVPTCRREVTQKHQRFGETWRMRLRIGGLKQEG
jgi:hypothetical protein